MIAAIPESMADVRPDWVLAALGAGGRLGEAINTIEDIRVDPMAAGKGLIGDLAVVQVRYRSPAAETAVGRERPEKLVLKLPAKDPDSRRIGTMLNAYGREAAFYEHVARDGATHLARCFYNGHDPSTDRWALMIDYIEPDPFDFLAGATPAQAVAAVDALASLHAEWWQGATEFEWMPGFDRGGVAGLAPIWEQNLPVFIERYGPRVPGATADWARAFATRLAPWSDAAAHEPLTLVHADYRLDNLVFQGGRVTIIDWQTAMRAPAAMDLSCFIATSLTVDQRRMHEEGLIDRYLAAIAERGVNIDAEWFRRSYDENLLWWMGQFGNNLAHLRPADPLVQQALAAMVERVFTAGHDRDVGRLL